MDGEQNLKRSANSREVGSVVRLSVTDMNISNPFNIFARIYIYIYIYIYIHECKGSSKKYTRSRLKKVRDCLKNIKYRLKNNI